MPLLQIGADGAMRHAPATYPEHYDDVLAAVRVRLQEAGEATKLDLAALIAWKHVRNAKCMTALLRMEAADVEAITRHALAPDLTDDDRICSAQVIARARRRRRLQLGSPRGGHHEGTDFAWTPRSVDMALMNLN